MLASVMMSRKVKKKKVIFNLSGPTLEDWTLLSDTQTSRQRQQGRLRDASVKLHAVALARTVTAESPAASLPERRPGQPHRWELLRNKLPPTQKTAQSC